MVILVLMVGRPRKVERDVALDRAMEVFWLKGYDATSMNDLVEATGLLKGSLYQNFDDKHSLFQRALKRYLDALLEQHKEHLSGDLPLRQKIRNALQALILLTKGENGQSRGCMAVNTLVGNTTNDQAITDILDSYYQKIMQLFVAAIERAVGDESLKPVHGPENTTALLMTLMTGLAVNSSSPMLEVESAFDLLEQQLDLLGL